MTRETNEQRATRDRERILAYFMQRLHASGITPLFEPYGTETWSGDLVFLLSAQPTMWQLSRFHERISDEVVVLSSVGTRVLCRWSNVSWRVVSRELSAHVDFLEGWQRRAFEAAMRALGQCNADMYRFRGVRFEGTRMYMTIGPHIWIRDFHSPFDIVIEAADRLSIQRARAALLAGGVGTRFKRP